MNNQNQPSFDPQQMKVYQDQFNSYRRRKAFRPLAVVVCVVSFCGLILMLGLWLFLYVSRVPKIEQVICPSTTVCYGAADDFLVSMDGGVSWSKHPLKNGAFKAI